MDNNSINNEITCFICKGKFNDPLMCKFCQIRFCKNCIENFYINENKNYCPKCQKNVRLDEMIPIPWLNDISNYLINKENNIIEDSNKNINNDNINPKNINDVYEFCEKHNNHYTKYCINCSNYLCPECLSIFDENSRIHERHEIINISEIEKYNLDEVLKKYKNINEKVKSYSDNIEFIDNYKKIIDVIKNYKLNFLKKYINNIEKNYKDLNDKLVNLKNKQQNEEKNFSKNIPKVDQIIRKIINEKNKNNNSLNALSKTLDKYDYELKNINKNVINDLNNNLIDNVINIEYFESDFIIFENLLLENKSENELLGTKEININIIPYFKITINFISTFIENKINLTILFEKINTNFENKMYKIFLYIQDLKHKKILNYSIPNIIGKKNNNKNFIKYSKLLNKEEINSCLDSNNNLIFKLTFEKINN